MKTHLRTNLLRLILGGFLLIPLLVQASDPLPLLINCQGRLHDGDAPMNGNVTMVLRVYTNATSGSFLYEDTANVEVTDGLYSTFLGDDTTRGNLLEALAAGEAYLEVTAGNTTFAPRERMVTVPYAVIAKAVVREGITEEMVSQGAVVERHLGAGSISSDKLADASVTAAKIADGAVSPDKLTHIPWNTTGNVAQPGKILVLGTLDNTPLDLTVSGRRAIRILPHVLTPSILGGNPANTVGEGSGGAVVAGGGTLEAPNRAEGDFVFIGSGEGNNASGAHAAIVGGWGNLAIGNRSFIGGGRDNIVKLAGGTIGGGYSNLVNGTYATIAGGFNGLAQGYSSSIGGGWGNSATGLVSAVAGGMQNHANGNATSVGGGYQNVAHGYGARVGGGQNNVAQGEFSVVGGGTNNVAVGKASIIPGGTDNQALGDYSFASGRGAQSAHNHTVVFSDGQDGAFTSSGPDQFVVRARGGVGIGTSNPTEQLEVAGNVKADNFIAGSFIGDGSQLTGVGVKPGSIRADHLAPDFILPASRIEGAALANQPLGGVLNGTMNNASIRPGTITADLLADGVIPVVPDLSLLADAVDDAVSGNWKLGGNDGVQAGTEFFGTLDRTPLEFRANNKGGLWMVPVDDGVGLASGAGVASVHKNSFVFSGDPNAPASSSGEGQVILNAPGNVGINTANPTEALTVEGTVKASSFVGDASGLTNLPLPVGLLTRGSEFQGDVSGPISNVRIRPGTISGPHLSPELMAQIQTGANQDTAARIAESQRLMEEQLVAVQAAERKDLLQTVEDRINTATAGIPSEVGILAQVDQKVAAATAGIPSEAGILAQVDQKVAAATAGIPSAAGILAQVDQKVAAATAALPNENALLAQMERKVAIAAATFPSQDEIMRQVDQKVAIAASTFPSQNEIMRQVDQKVAAATATLPTSVGMMAQVDQKIAQATATLPNGTVIMQQVEQRLGDVESKIPDANLLLARVDQKVAAATATVPSEAGIMTRVDQKIAAATSRLPDAGLLLAQVDQKIAASTANIPNTTALLSEVDRKVAIAAAETPSMASIQQQIAASSQSVLSQVNAKIAASSASSRLPTGIRVQAGETPSLAFGHSANAVAAGVKGGTVAGGGSQTKPNRVTGNFGTIGGGNGNTATGYNAAVSGGEQNNAGGIATAIGGGMQNLTDGEFTTVAGGGMNQASGKFASIGGGEGNKASGTAATVIGGQGNVASGDFSVAAGRNAKALHNGSIVLADNGGGSLSSSAENQLIARASGGAYLFSSANGATGVRLAPGGGSWDNLSDRNSKNDLEQVDGEAVLRKLETMPIYNYEYNEQAGIRHMGPVAQDFSAAFKLGHDDVRINSLDADGVALAAIQGLSQRLAQRDAQVAELQQQVQALSELVGKLVK